MGGVPWEEHRTPGLVRARGLLRQTTEQPFVEPATGLNVVRLIQIWFRVRVLSVLCRMPEHMQVGVAQSLPCPVRDTVPSWGRGACQADGNGKVLLPTLPILPWDGVQGLQVASGTVGLSEATDCGCDFVRDRSEHRLKALRLDSGVVATSPFSAWMAGIVLEVPGLSWPSLAMT